jgi:hypothetical protein
LGQERWLRPKSRAEHDDHSQRAAQATPNDIHFRTPIYGGVHDSPSERPLGKHTSPRFGLDLGHFIPLSFEAQSPPNAESRPEERRPRALEKAGDKECHQPHARSTP